MNTSLITTHVLDTALGRPASAVPVSLSQLSDDAGGSPHVWSVLATAVTDHNGRVENFDSARDIGPAALPAGRYRLVFDTEAYFSLTSTESFFSEITIVFTVTEDGKHYHVPLLLSPFAYSTYRGN
jgi:5-hydroxyisourate hydrolase